MPANSMLQRVHELHAQASVTPSAQAMERDRQATRIERKLDEIIGLLEAQRQPSIVRVYQQTDLERITGGSGSDRQRLRSE